MRDLLVFVLAELVLDFAVKVLLLFAEVFFVAGLVGAGFLPADFFAVFVAVPLFLPEVLLFAAGLFLGFEALVLDFFAWEDFFEVVAITGRIIQKKGNVVKGVPFS